MVIYSQLCASCWREMEILQALQHNYKQVAYKVIIFYNYILCCYNFIPLKFGLPFFRQRSTVSKFSDFGVIAPGAIIPTHINVYHTIIPHPLTSIFISFFFLILTFQIFLLFFIQQLKFKVYFLNFQFQPCILRMLYLI